MSRTGKILRRTFLVGSAAVAGGVAFGYYFVTRPPKNPLLDSLEEGEAALTPFIKITPEEVIFFVPHGDVGQGIYSMQANLIAEELDIDPASVRIEPPEPAPAYYNGTVTADAAPFPGYDQGWLAETMRDFMRLPGKLLALQMTGGSTSVPETFEKLRKAGAVARETLKKAAAQRAGVSVADLDTEDGHVLMPDGSRMAYTELGTEAAKISLVTGVELRSPDRWRLLGKKVQRTDMVDKSTGRQKYGIDLRMEGMLHATVRANPGVGGEVKSFDAKAAETMRGVKKVLPVTSGVAVVADNTWRAFRAADAIKIDWEPGPYPASSDEMWKTLEESIDTESYDSRNRDDGDVDAALAEGKVIEAEYRLPYLAHAPLEPLNAVAKVTDDRVDVWTGTQIPAFLRDHAAQVTGHDSSKVHVHGQYMGGSFGLRLEDTYALQAVEIANQMRGTPIKMTWTREEDMSHDYPRPMHMARGRGTVKDGRVETLDLSSCSQSIAASWFGRLMGAPPGPDVIIVLGAWDQPYAIPNYRVTGYKAPEMVPVSSWRAPGSNCNAFFHDTFLDELIHAAGADPMEERIRLCSDDLSRKTLEAVKEMSGWDGPKMGENRARGVAFTHSHGVPAAEVIEIRQTDAGIKIDKVYVAVEVGKVLDPVNFEAQVTGGIVFGLGHAMNCELTYKDYKPIQTNYHAFEGMRLYQTPEIVVKGLENGEKVRGIGEPSLPPAAPALGNAIFALTGKRVRQLPFYKSVDFV